LELDTSPHYRTHRLPHREEHHYSPTTSASLLAGNIEAKASSCFAVNNSNGGVLDGNSTTSTMAVTPRPLVSTKSSAAFGSNNEGGGNAGCGMSRGEATAESFFELESPKCVTFGDSPNMRNKKLSIDTLFRKRSKRFPRRLQPLLKESNKVEKVEKSDRDVKVEKLDKDKEKDKAENRNPRAGTPLAVSTSFPPQRKLNRENRPPKNLPPQQSSPASGFESIRHESRLVK
jgi:hypothetical protein